MTASERHEALRDANEKMKFYYENRPSLKELNKHKKKFGDENHHFIMAGAMSTFLCLFLFTPFLGKVSRSSLVLFNFFLLVELIRTLFVTSFFSCHEQKIATDDEFREKYIPKFYDYSIEKPDYAWTRAELHEQMVQLQMDLHKRAINGEFTPEKLEEMRRHFDGVNPEKDEHGWGKIHPGVDDDEDIEED